MTRFVEEPQINNNTNVMTSRRDVSRRKTGKKNLNFLRPFPIFVSARPGQRLFRSEESLKKSQSGTRR